MRLRQPFNGNLDQLFVIWCTYASHRVPAFCCVEPGARVLAGTTGAPWAARVVPFNNVVKGDSGRSSSLVEKRVDPTQRRFAGCEPCRV